MEVDVGPLVESRGEYQVHLNAMINKKMYEHFHTLFLLVRRGTENNPRVLWKAFQSQLKKIQHWNQVRVEEIGKKILGEDETLFSQLLTALLVLKCKILTSFKLDRHDKNLNLKVPSFHHFLHKAFAEAAQSFYENPLVFSYLLFDSPETFQNGYHDAIRTINDAIETTVNSFVPMRDILQEYVANAMKAPDGYESDSSSSRSGKSDSSESKPPQEDPEHSVVSDDDNDNNDKKEAVETAATAAEEIDDPAPPMPVPTAPAYPPPPPNPDYPLPPPAGPNATHTSPQIPLEDQIVEPLERNDVETMMRESYPHAPENRPPRMPPPSSHHQDGGGGQMPVRWESEDEEDDADTKTISMASPPPPPYPPSGSAPAPPPPPPPQQQPQPPRYYG
jgi:hypothetical protein